MPRYGCINERRHQLHEVIRLSGMNEPHHRRQRPSVDYQGRLIPSARCRSISSTTTTISAARRFSGIPTKAISRRQRRTGHLLREACSETAVRNGADAYGRPLPRLVFGHRPDLSEKGLRRRPDLQRGQDRRFQLYGDGFDKPAERRNEGENRQRRRQETKNCRSSTPLHTKTSACRYVMEYADGIIHSFDAVNPEVAGAGPQQRQTAPGIPVARRRGLFRQLQPIL